MHWYLQVLKKYAVFSGRATRKEFWMFMLVYLIIVFVLNIIIAITKPSGNEASGISILVLVFYVLYILTHLVPGIAVTVRRLHDTGRSGWWYFINFVPLIGSIVLIVFLVQDSQSHDNQYGPNPKMVADITLET